MAETRHSESQDEPSGSESDTWDTESKREAEVVAKNKKEGGVVEKQKKEEDVADKQKKEGDVHSSLS